MMRQNDSFSITFCPFPRAHRNIEFDEQSLISRVPLEMVRWTCHFSTLHFTSPRTAYGFYTTDFCTISLMFACH